MAEEWQELRALVDRQNYGDAGLFTDLLVVLTVGGGLVDDAGAVGGGDVVGHEEAPGVLRAVLLGVVEVVPERLVAEGLELGAGVAGGDSRFRGGGTLGAVAVAKVLGVGAQQVRGKQEAARDRGLGRRGLDPVRAGRQHNVGDGGPTASARLVGSVQGVVVHASAWTPASCTCLDLPAVMGKVTVTVWSWRFL